MAVTLREIAEETGLSRMAVSLALRGKPGVSEANRKRVLKTAERLGYQPDPDVARYLSHIRKSSSSETRACLALLTSGPGPQWWKKSTTERMYVEGAMERAKAYGYRLEEFWMDDPKMPLRRLGNILWNRGIEGVLLTPILGVMGPDQDRRVEMDFKRFAVVEISETLEAPQVDRALHDQYTSMLRLLRHLRELGYQRIGLVLETALARRVNGKWTAAYLLDGRTHPESRLRPLILPEPDLGKFRKWLSTAKPDVVVSVARFGWRLLEAAELSVPEDLSYASLDVRGLDPEGTFCSGIDQQSHAVGAAAVDLLTTALQRGDFGIPQTPRRMQVEGIWVSGSTAPGPE